MDLLATPQKANPEFNRFITIFHHHLGEYFLHVPSIKEANPKAMLLDGSIPAPPGMCKNPVNNGINYQPQLVLDF